MIDIHILLHRRYNALPIHTYFFDKCKYKDRIRINLLDHGYHECAEKINTEINNFGIKCEYHHHFIKYMDKIHYAIYKNSNYSIKLDEDCFINNYVWDYLIENIGILNDENNLAVAPCLSAGIPTHDFFCKDVFSEEQNIILNTMKKNTHFSHKWGIDYHFLNKATVNSSEWHEDYFYSLMSSFGSIFKGYHPIRLNYELLLKTNEFLLDNFEKIVKKNNFYIQDDLNKPYLCNSLFAIKTDVWRKIIDNKSLFVDLYDELPLNRYKDMTGKKYLYIRNSNGIHTLYNCYDVADNGYENNFIEKIKQRLGV